MPIAYNVKLHSIFFCSCKVCKRRRVRVLVEYVWCRLLHNVKVPPARQAELRRAIAFCCRVSKLEMNQCSQCFQCSKLRFNWILQCPNVFGLWTSEVHKGTPKGDQRDQDRDQERNSANMKITRRITQRISHSKLVTWNYQLGKVLYHSPPVSPPQQVEEYLVNGELCSLKTFENSQAASRRLLSDLMPKPQSLRHATSRGSLEIPLEAL